MSPICATFHRSCQSCKITRTAEPARPARPAEAPHVANPAPRSGRRKASLRDQNPGSEKKRGSELAKKPAMSQPAFRMGLPRYRPQAAPRLAARVPGVSDERPNLPKPKACAPQSPCLQVPAMPSQSPRALFIPACAGNRCPRAWWLIAMSVHPRVCGEQARMARASCTLPQTVHPRVCGEQTAIVTAGFTSARFRNRFTSLICGAGRHGSSPRVRGTGPHLKDQLCDHSVHPRVCGEQGMGVGSNGATGGFIPACAGNRSRPMGHHARRRFIPACAGNSREVRSSKHPRRGSSPRVRGTVRPQAQAHPIWAAVHPRVCGEQSITLE